MYVRTYILLLCTYVYSDVYSERANNYDGLCMGTFKNQILNHKWIKTAVSKRDSYEL